VTEWYWSEAGDLERVPVLHEDGRPDYDPKKGEFVWTSNVRPVLRYHNGKWNRVMIGVNDQRPEDPVVLASPAADRSDPDAMIFPFKKMIGNQVADAGNDTVLVPHLFKATAAMPNPYWGIYDWPLSVWDAVGYPTGQTFTGEHKFVATEALLAVDHEVAPKQDAFGANGECSDCHGQGQIDWAALGWDQDPYLGIESDVYLSGILVPKLVRLPVGRETPEEISVLDEAASRRKWRRPRQNYNVTSRPRLRGDIPYRIMRLRSYDNTFRGQFQASVRGPSQTPAAQGSAAEDH
jgi:hypothetical protein